MPWKISSKLKTSYFPIDLKVVVIVVKFDPSSFTYAIYIFSIHIDETISLDWWPRFDQY
jgi:hypothetical protein